ncbi:hypothetical protein A5892_09065 [Halotalea alkalilenta]|uniref:Metallo-beta-lactamase domain-containing protein n=2 Tax=Halotalea alkalilenta TaxID=376489 RepID=A0A172YK87_9GAMM|nr:hypothetical protein A5892_09065 [Halotalea alkalilenta]
MGLLASGQNHASFDFGGLKVIALRDGYVDMPPSRLRQGSGQAMDRLPDGLPLVDGQLRLSVNAFVIIDEQRAVLIDTGASNSWEPTMGRLPEALREAGIDSESITHVALTHTHTDHLNGLIAADGSQAFPQARQIFVPREEASAFSGRLSGLRDRLVPIDDGFAVSERITAVKAAGHSPGHTAYEVRSDAGRLLVWGDIVHVPFIQFERPEITWQFDGDQSRAREARMAILERVAQPDYLIAGAHLDFPGIGSVTRAEQGFSFKPLS